MQRITPALTLLLVCALPGAAAAYSHDDPGPTLAGAVAIGASHAYDGPRLELRLQGWLPPPTLPRPLRLGLEGSFGLEGDEAGTRCVSPADGPLAEHRGVCAEAAVGARLLVGLEAGHDLVGRLEGGVGPAWRRAIDGDDPARWSLSLAARAVGLVAVGQMLGGLWRVGLSVEASSYGGAAPAFAGGLVFGATVID